MHARLIRPVLFFVLIAACSGGPGGPEEVINAPLNAALRKLQLSEETLSVPKLPRPYSTPGRLPAVDIAMQRPLTMITLSRRLAQTEPTGNPARYLSRLLADLKVGISSAPEVPGVPTAAQVWDQLVKASSGRDKDREIPGELQQDTPVARVLRLLLSAAATAQQGYAAAAGKPTAKEWAAIRDHLQTSISSTARTPEPHGLILDEYHEIGARTDVTAMANRLLGLLAAVEQVVPELVQAAPTMLPLEWMTPLGRVRVAGAGADHHQGDFLLLIDLGGDDTYDDVGRVLEPGKVSLVVDLGGNDTVGWKTVPGPGAGIMGLGLWVDLAGDDRYAGRNLGLGVGLFGAGLLWDAAGNDVYQGGAGVEGSGQYGIGLLLDGGGNDVYAANLHSQGYGGTGGYGIQIDLQGDDRYSCTPLVPDQIAERNRRHGAIHYLSFCQGYGFGRRPEISGGIGLLLDRHGEDRYQADLFAQGGAYWFGLGMLVDGDGNDRYEAYEHCQGESLHLGAGFLGDWGGDDEYTGYEHCQGVGIDRAVGVLYDASGHDQYRSGHESQGAGIKPYGVGLLIDAAGNDHYQATQTSQGYSARPPPGFPDNQWPVGMLLDLGGADHFVQPGVPIPEPRGRVQNRQGIAVDK